MPGDSTDIHQEGVIIPPVKLFRAGEPDEQIWRILLSNTRTPESSYGDFMAMVGLLVTGERRIDELVERFGTQELLGAFSELQRYAERRMRAAIREIPNGVYDASILADDDGVDPDPHLIQVRVAVLDEDVVVDFRGSAPQAQGPINCPYGVTLAACANALFSVVDHTIPHNQGAFRPLHLIAPAGTIVNCDYPAPLSAGNTESHNLIAEVVIAALRQALPDRTTALTGATTGLITGVASTPIATSSTRSCSGSRPATEPAGRPMASRSRPGSLRRPVSFDRGDRDGAALACPRLLAAHGLGRRRRRRGGLGITRTYEMLSERQVFNSIAHYHRFLRRWRAASTARSSRSGSSIRTAASRPRLDRSADIVSPAKFSGCRAAR